MQNKTVLITGGASGIGRASAITFAKSGANVFIIDIDITGAEAVAEEIAAFGGNVVVHKADVTQEKEVDDAVAYCVELFSTIEYAHNNAGIVICDRPQFGN